MKTSETLRQQATEKVSPIYRILNNVKCAILLPDSPRSDLAALLKASGLGLVLPQPTGFQIQLENNSAI